MKFSQLPPGLLPVAPERYARSQCPLLAGEEDPWEMEELGSPAVQTAIKILEYDKAQHKRHPWRTRGKR